LTIDGFISVNHDAASHALAALGTVAVAGYNLGRHLFFNRQPITVANSVAKLYHVI